MSRPAGGAAVLCAVCSLLSVFYLFFLVFKLCQIQKQELAVDDEINWNARVTCMKSSFPRLKWPWIISVFASVKGTSVPRCPIYLIMIGSSRINWCKRVPGST